MTQEEVEVSTMDLSQITWRKARSSANNGSCVEVGTWRKSSHSIGNGGECLEIGDGWKSIHDTDEGQCAEVRAWRKSRQSTGNGGQCVEVVAEEAVVLARDSKDPGGPVLALGTDAWTAFLTTVKTGSLDLHRAAPKLR